MVFVYVLLEKNLNYSSLRGREIKSEIYNWPDKS
jgi:hypothetical protein